MLNWAVVLWLKFIQNRDLCGLFSSLHINYGRFENWDLLRLLFSDIQLCQLFLFDVKSLSAVSLNEMFRNRNHLLNLFCRLRKKCRRGIFISPRRRLPTVVSRFKIPSRTSLICRPDVTEILIMTKYPNYSHQMLRLPTSINKLARVFRRFASSVLLSMRKAFFQTKNFLSHIVSTKQLLPCLWKIVKIIN